MDVAQNLQGKNMLLLDTHSNLWTFRELLTVILTLPRVIIKTYGCTVVEGSLVLASSVIFAGIYVHLHNNEGSCSFRPSL